MANTFVKIASVTVGAGGASTMALTSIPATYTDLMVMLSIRGTVTTPDVGYAMQINGVTTDRTYRQLFANGATAGSGSGALTSPVIGTMQGSQATASIFNNASIYIPNYAGSNNKSFSVDNVTENNGTTAYMNMFACLWANSSAITSLTFYMPDSTDFVQYSTATLYGIKNS